MIAGHDQFRRLEGVEELPCGRELRAPRALREVAQIAIRSGAALWTAARSGAST